MYSITIPKWAKIVDYRTMNDAKKRAAVEGNKLAQAEWMREESNEFYEAIFTGDKNEIFDEAMGLIRTAQHFNKSKRVMDYWRKVRPDVKLVFANECDFIDAFKKWKQKKLQKGQAKDVEPEHLIRFARLKW